MKGDGDGNYDDSREVSKQFKIYFKSIEHYDKKKKKKIGKVLNKTLHQRKCIETNAHTKWW